MSLRETREHLQIQILETGRMLGLTGDHPVMTPALNQRKVALEEELKRLPAAAPQPRAVLFFAGEPVLGSRGIDAQFASTILQPFLQMVKTQYTAVKHGRVGSRGVRRDESEAKLLLTGLPRGSFGLELSQLDSDDFIATEQLSNVLVQLTNVIQTAGKDDESFTYSLEGITPRVMPKLKEFFKIASDNHSSMRIVSGNLECKLDGGSVLQAYERISATSTKEEPVEYNGIFRGATLESWRFDFRKDDGEVISGYLSDEISEGAALAMVGLTGKYCQANLQKITVITRSGSVHPKYELSTLTQIDQLLPPPEI